MTSGFHQEITKILLQPTSLSETSKFQSAQRVIKDTLQKMQPTIQSQLIQIKGKTKKQKEFKFYVNQNMHSFLDRLNNQAVSSVSNMPKAHTIMMISDIDGTIVKYNKDLTKRENIAVTGDMQNTIKDSLFIVASLTTQPMMIMNNFMSSTSDDDWESFSEHLMKNATACQHIIGGETSVSNGNIKLVDYKGEKQRVGLQRQGKSEGAGLFLDAVSDMVLELSKRYQNLPSKKIHDIITQSLNIYHIGDGINDQDMVKRINEWGYKNHLTHDIAEHYRTPDLKKFTPNGIQDMLAYMKEQLNLSENLSVPVFFDKLNEHLSKNGQNVLRFNSNEINTINNLLIHSAGDIDDALTWKLINATANGFDRPSAGDKNKIYELYSKLAAHGSEKSSDEVEENIHKLGLNLLRHITLKSYLSEDFVLIESPKKKMKFAEK